MATLYNPDGTEKEVQPEKGRYFHLQELYKLLGCSFIEVAYPLRDPKHILIIDEEGKLHDPPKPLNLAATTIYNNAPDWISGPALYCLRGELD